MYPLSLCSSNTFPHFQVFFPRKSSKAKQTRVYRRIKNQGTCPWRLVNHVQLGFHLLHWWSRGWNVLYLTYLSVKACLQTQTEKLKLFPHSVSHCGFVWNHIQNQTFLLLSISDFSVLYPFLFILFCRAWNLGRLSAGDVVQFTSMCDCITAVTASVWVNKQIWVIAPEFHCYAPGVNSSSAVVFLKTASLRSWVRMYVQNAKNQMKKFSKCFCSSSSSELSLIWTVGVGSDDAGCIVFHEENL